jgi:hypothetical protein
VDEFVGLRREVERLRAENARLSRLLELRGQDTAPAPEQLSAPVAAPGLVTMASPVGDKLALFADRFRVRVDVYAVRWENTRTGAAGWMPAVAGGWRKGLDRRGAAYVPRTQEVVAARNAKRAATGADVATMSRSAATRVNPALPPVVHAEAGAGLSLDAAQLTPAALATFRHAAAMANPKFYELQRLRKSTWDTPRFIRGYDLTLDDRLVLPRGLRLLDLPNRSRLAGGVKRASVRFEGGRSSLGHYAVAALKGVSGWCPIKA